MNRGFKWVSSNINGIFSNHETALNLNVPYTGNFEVVFAPTALPPSSACIEMATTHRRYPDDELSTRHLAAWWDWCEQGGKPDSAAVEEDMTNSAWKDTYTYLSIFNNNRYFVIQIIPDGPECWEGLIFNFATGTWDHRLHSCYPPGKTENWTGNGNEGWSMWEGAGDNLTKTCPDLNGTTTLTTQVFDPATGWHDINTVVSLNEGNRCWFTQSDWDMTTTDYGSGSGWDAFTPFP